MQELRTSRLDAERVLVICNSMGKAEDLYDWMLRDLGSDGFVGLSSLPRYYRSCLVQLLHSQTAKDERDFILNTFMEGGGIPRLLVCTSLGELGIDYQALWRMIQMGLPSTISQMIQAWGRPGRDGLPSVVTILANGHTVQPGCQGLRQEQDHM